MITEPKLLGNMTLYIPSSENSENTRRIAKFREGDIEIEIECSQGSVFCRIFKYGCGDYGTLNSTSLAMGKGKE